MARNAKDQVNIIIDGRSVRTAFRTPLLQVARELGIAIPTLCHHDDLEPGGACRLCLVEEHRDGWSKFVTACNYPVSEGMVFSTASEAVLRHRRLTMESLLARCPESSTIRELATKLGVTSTRFIPGDDTCILCGLCTRVCESFATTAIATLQRGVDKVVGTFGDEPPADCVACGACAAICPTGHIPVERSGETYRIWERDFPLAICTVDTDRCRGCGACEEACPFDIPRVLLKRGGLAKAEIRADVCKACGVCVAACPTGAITQKQVKALHVSGEEAAKPSAGNALLVIACGRANLSGQGRPPLPDGVTLFETPCAGSATPGQLIGALARGFSGVLVLGRHEQTCRLDGAEEHARVLVERMNELCVLLGLGDERLFFEEPAPGPDGAYECIETVLAELQATPLTENYEGSVEGGMDEVFAIVDWLARRPELSIDASEWLREKGLPAAEPGRPVLLAGMVPWLDILLGEWLRGDELVDMLLDSLAALKALGIEAGVAVGGFLDCDDGCFTEHGGSEFYCLGSGSADRSGEAGRMAIPIDDLLAERIDAVDADGGEADGPGKVALDLGSETLLKILRGLGCGEVDAGVDPDPGLRILISNEERRAMEDRLAQAAADGAETLLLDGPTQLIQYLLLARRGSWRGTHVRPVLAPTLVAADLAARQV